MASLSNWVLSLKVVLFSTGVLSLAMALKFSVPLVSDFIFSEVPSIWSFLLAWLRPPYLYILLNCIIISIVASSKLQNHKLVDHSHSPDPLAVLPPDPNIVPEPVKISGDMRSDYAVYNGPGTAVTEVAKISGDVRTDCSADNGVVSNGHVGDAGVSEMIWGDVQGSISNVEKMRVSNGEIANEESDHAPSSIVTSLQRKESFGFSFPDDNDKSPVSARFGHRKAARAIPPGGKAALRVSKPKRQDTLESTWRTITEGRAMPLTRHLKKCDTWDSHLRRNAPPLTDQNGSTPPNSKLMKKSETFSERSSALKENDSSASPSPASGKMRKEPSLSQDELNRRVEAFIRKFNEEMRLQRQESLRQYQDMINHGTP